MRYVEFRDALEARLRKCPGGMTWKELREDLGLPYDRPCPEWTRRLEKEIHLVRQKATGKALVWRLRAALSVKKC